MDSTARRTSHLNVLDESLTRVRVGQSLSGLHRIGIELLWFGLKEARACLFAGLFFAAVFLMPRQGVLGIPRYDLLLLFALAIQGWMLWTRLETWDEARAITLFHIVGF